MRWQAARRTYLQSTLVLLSIACSSSQVSQELSSIPDPLSPQLLTRDGGISTSLGDSFPTKTFPADSTPKQFADLRREPVSPTGVIALTTPGAYQMLVESYCMHVGSKAPRGAADETYLAAPLKGRLADVFRTLIEGRRAHREIPQTDVQLLIWGLLLNEKVSALGSGPRNAALRLLSPRQLAETDAVPRVAEFAEGALGAEISKLPPEAQQLLQAERRVRTLLESGTATYEEIARVAAPSGTAAPTTKTPGHGDWSETGNGVYIRYVPQNYSRTLVQIYMPHPPLSGEAVFRQASLKFSPTTTPLAAPVALNGIAAIPTYAAQRLAVSSVPTSLLGDVTGQVQAAKKRAHCAKLPIEVLNEATGGYTYSEKAGSGQTSPWFSSTTLPQNVLDGLAQPIEDADPASFGTLYHEAMHAALAQFKSDPAWSKFISAGTGYYTGAPLDNGQITRNPYGVFSESAALYVGARVSAYVHALQRLDVLRKSGGCPLDPKAVATVAAGYDASMARSNDTHGDDQDASGDPSTTRPFPTFMKDFIDNTVFGGQVPDKFASSPRLSAPCPPPLDGSCLRTYAPS